MSAQYNVTRVRVVPFRSQQDSRLAEKVDYPAFKGPSAPAATANGTSVSALFPVHAYFANIKMFQNFIAPPGFSFKLRSPLLLFLPQMGDNTLAQSAQMYHYQHQKQQMLSMEK